MRKATKFIIVAGNPIDGLTFYGFFDSEIEAEEAASNDKHLQTDWWIAAVHDFAEE